MIWVGNAAGVGDLRVSSRVSMPAALAWLPVLLFVKILACFLLPAPSPETSRAKARIAFLHADKIDPRRTDRHISTLNYERRPVAVIQSDGQPIRLRYLVGA